VRLHKTYARPHLEFASTAWRPWLQKDKDAIERVQEKMVNQVGGLKGRNYSEKLAELGLQFLEDRRIEADMVLMFKVVTGRCKVRS